MSKAPKTQEISKVYEIPSIKNEPENDEHSTPPPKKDFTAPSDGVVSILKKPAEVSPSFVRLMYDAADESSEKRSVTICDEEMVIIDFPGRQFDFSTEDDIEANEQLNTHSKVDDTPNGGWGWVITASAFFLNVIIIGTHNIFGLLFLDLVHEFGESLFKTSTVGSIAFGCILIFGPVGGILSNKFGCRIVAMVGVGVATMSLLWSSFATSIDMLSLTYGLGFGFGTSLSYMQGVVIVSKYFSSRRAFATGIVFCGSSLGTVVMAPIYNLLTYHLGWRSALRMIAAIVSITFLCALTYRPPNFCEQPAPTIEERIQRSPAKRFIMDLSLWKNKAFIIWAISVGLCKLGYLVPFVHLVKHVNDIGGDRDFGSSMLSLMGITSGISRLLFGHIADSPKVNRLYMSQLSALVMGLTNIIFPSIPSEGGVLVYVLILGLVDGGIEILLPVMTLDLVGNENMTIAWGCLLAVISCSALGPPIAGAIRDIEGDYSGAFYFAGSPMILSTFTLFLIPLWAQKQSQQPATSFLSIDPSKLDIDPTEDDLKAGDTVDRKSFPSICTIFHSSKTEK
ncbi:monocarboxylate transporter 10-like [Styela clava]